VLLLMLALPLWIAWGPKAPLRILPAKVQNFATDLFIQPSSPTVSNLPKTDARQPTTSSPEPVFAMAEALLLGIYLFGALIFFARLAIGTWKARRLMRESSPIEYFSAEEALSSANVTAIANREKSRHPEGREATRQAAYIRKALQCKNLSREP
jgi:hypothetical protein